jgi:hypothetical protein
MITRKLNVSSEAKIPPQKLTAQTIEPLGEDLMNRTGDKGRKKSHTQEIPKTSPVAREGPKSSGVPWEAPREQLNVVPSKTPKSQLYPNQIFEASQEDPKSTASSRDSSDMSGDFWRKECKDLERRLEETKELHSKQLQELDQQWRAKCATLYTEMLERSEGDKQRLLRRIAELESKVAESKEEEYKVEVFHSANLR